MLCCLLIDDLPLGVITQAWVITHQQWLDLGWLLPMFDQATYPQGLLSRQEALHAILWPTTHQ
jgi:hypothetical protein